MLKGEMPMPPSVLLEAVATESRFTGATLRGVSFLVFILSLFFP